MNLKDSDHFHYYEVGHLYFLDLLFWEGHDFIMTYLEKIVVILSVIAVFPQILETDGDKKCNFLGRSFMLFWRFKIEHHDWLNFPTTTPRIHWGAY